MANAPDVGGLDTAAIFEQYVCAQWQVGRADALFFPVLRISETGGNRIVQQERPFRDGAKLDDTGSIPRQWCLTAHFSNRIAEPGTEQNGEPLYPGVLNAMVRSFDEHETGVLTLPTVGVVRVKAEKYTRTEESDSIDVGMLELTFTQDNEDALDRAQLNPPTVIGSLKTVANTVTGSLKRDGAWGEDHKSILEFASEIEGLMLAPGRATADLMSVVTAHRRALYRVLNTAQSEMEKAGLVGAPTNTREVRGSESERLLRTMLDREAAAEDERTASRPRTLAFVIDVEQTSIYEIAARLDQDAEELLDLNAARVSNPFYLTRGEVIRVFESAPR
jgi:DNA circularisation protein